MKENMKALIDIKRQLWATVKYVAIVRNVSVNLAVEQLLSQALKESSYLQAGLEALH
jgi:hypothetical protein